MTELEQTNRSVYLDIEQNNYVPNDKVRFKGEERKVKKTLPYLDQKVCNSVEEVYIYNQLNP